MSDFDVFDDSDHLPADHLINELESIKGLLHSNNDGDNDGETAELPTDIPLLDDMVIGNLGTNTRLLNLNRIFVDDSAEDHDEVDEQDDWEEDEIELTTPPLTLTPRTDIPFPRFTLDTMLSDDAPEPEAPLTPAVAAAIPTASSTLSSAVKAPTTTARVRPDYSRDVLIQELVDEFVPQIEAALRERLNQLDTSALQQWKDRD